MKLRAGRIGFSFDYLSLSLLCAAAVIFGTRFLPAFLCAAAHESCHALALLCFGEDEVRLILRPGGAAIIDRNKALRSDGQTAAVAAAGPLANILLTLPCAAIYSKTGSPFFHACLLMNAALALFNLLPILSTDGGEIAGILFRRLFSAEISKKILTITTVALLLPIAVGGFLLLFRSRENFTLLFCVCAIVFSVIRGE